MSYINGLPSPTPDYTEDEDFYYWWGDLEEVHDKLIDAGILNEDDFWEKPGNWQGMLEKCHFLTATIKAIPAEFPPDLDKYRRNLWREIMQEDIDEVEEGSRRYLHL